MSEQHSSPTSGPSAEKRRIKIGIDVGGTFTHAVAVNIDTMDLVGKAVVPTTHTAREGVAAGVVASMRKLLDETHIGPDEVVLIAHSTTQATNALLEGDVARVGIVGMGTGAGAMRARGETNVGDIELAQGKFLRTGYRFLDTGRDFTDETIRKALVSLREDGCEAIVASESFGVDNPEREQRVVDLAIDLGMPATASSSLSQIYGLRIRTRTAVINASMLPKMLETANRTEQAVRESGINAPLMVMRSDGGIMDIDAMRRRPILTMLSGPAAGVAAALMYERISDGSMAEVGGTSTDVCVIKNGRPIVTNGEIGGHRLFIRTLDVRTVGIAGGSVPRVRQNRLIDVGPRSAHIAGLHYEAFTSNIDKVEVANVQPRPTDPEDYLGLKINGEATPSVTLTPTGAANMLGLATAYGKGDKKSIEKCFAAVAEHVRMDATALADRMLDLATRKVIPVVRTMLEEQKLLQDRKITLVGGGGGAEAIVPYTAQKMKLEYRIARNNEVISAIGAALGIIQDTVERSIVSPTEADIVALRKEAYESVLRMGADPSSIQVIVEVDRQSKRVRATANGTPELRTRTLGGDLPKDHELQAKAADIANVVPHDMKRMSPEGNWMQVYQGKRERRILLGLLVMEYLPTVVIDREGIVRLQLPDAMVNVAKAGEVDGLLGTILTRLTTFGDAGEVLPDIYLVKPGQITDLTGLVEAQQILSVARIETQMLGPDDEVTVISARKG